MMRYAPRVRLLVLLALAACSSHSHGRTVRVAAASDLTRAFEELGAAFEKKTGITPMFDFGSSGLLAKKIEQGAPYYLFAAASREYADAVIQSGHCDGASARSYARGRVVVWCPTGVAAPASLADLADPRFKRIAIANPDHAPYGKAARQALDKAGVWRALDQRVVLADSVQGAMQYAKSGQVDAAIVALSLAVVTDGGTFLAVDPADHDPLDQVLVVCGQGDEADAARQFAEFVTSADGHELMTRYGFLLPGEPMKATK
jgi:molybdate transport system substrate-binding protein